MRRDIGRIWAMGMSSGGTFIHGLQTGLLDVHTVRLGDDRRVAEQPRPVSSTFAGNNQAPDWSPDGTMLAYVSTRGAVTSGSGSRAIVIRDHATGHERLLYPEMLFLNAPRWSPDGTRLLVKGRSATSNRWGEFIVDARTGAVTPAVTAEALGDEGEIGPHQWVPGREAILFGRHEKGIVEVDLASGQETMLVPVAAGTSFSAGRGVAYSPDGRTLAWSVHERKAGARPESVLRVRNGDGTIRELLRATVPDGHALMAWAPDGGAVYVVRHFGAPVRIDTAARRTVARAHRRHRAGTDGTVRRRDAGRGRASRRTHHCLRHRPRHVGDLGDGGDQVMPRCRMPNAAMSNDGAERRPWNAG